MNATVAMTGQGGWPMTVLPDPRRPPVLLRHVLPEAAVPAAARRRRRDLARAARRGRAGRPISVAAELRRMAVRTARRRPGDRPGAVRPRRRRRSCATRTPSAAASAGRRSSRRRRCWSPCCATTSAPARRCRWARWPRDGCGDGARRDLRPARRAGSRATASTPTGWCRTSRRCCTTTRCCCGPTRTGRGAPATRWPARVAAQTAQFLLDDLRTTASMFTSSLDADAAGVGGLAPTCGRPRSCARCSARTTAAGRQGFSGSPSAARSSTAPRCCSCCSDPDDPERFERVRAALLAARSARRAARRATTRWWPRGTVWRSPRWPKPVWRWMIRRCWTRPLRCARAIVDLHYVDGRLRRASLGGVVGDSAAILEDYAALATGLLALYQLTADENWLATASGLIGVGPRAFRRPGPARPLVRHRRRRRAADGPPADPVDGATPAGASLIAEALLTVGHMVDGHWAARYREAAADTLLAHSALLAKAPRSAGHWLAVAEAAVAARCRWPSRHRTRTHRCWMPRGCWRPAGRSSLAARWTRRRCSPGATGCAARTRPTYAAAGCAICR